MTTADLTLWVDGGAPLPALKRLLKGFRSAPVAVRVLPRAALWDGLWDAFKGRPGALRPDVAAVDAAWVGTLASVGALAELTPRQWEVDRAGVLPPLWELGYLPGARRLFSVPWMLDLRTLHVRRDADVSDAELADWDGLRRAAAGISIDGEGVLAASAPWVWGAGGDFVSEEGKPLFHRGEGFWGFSRFQGFRREGAGVLRWSPMTGRRKGGGRPLPPPRGPAGRAAYLGGRSLVLPAGHPREAAWALARHLCSPAVQEGLSRAGFGLPPRASEAERLLPPSDRAAFRATLSCARTPAAGPRLGAFERLMDRAAAGAEGLSWTESAARDTEELFRAHGLSHPAPGRAPASELDKALEDAVRRLVKDLGVDRVRAFAWDGRARAFSARAEATVWSGVQAPSPGASFDPAAPDSARASAPMVHRGETLGWLAADNVLSRATVGPEQGRMLETGAALTALSARLASLYDGASLDAATDGLTRLYLGRVFLARLEEECRRSERTGTSFAVVMLDVDRFKAINDAHGHPAGDRVLAGVARTLKKVSRRMDVVARYAGDEFIVLLPDAGADQAMRFARRVVEGVRRLSVPASGQPAAAKTGQAVRPTVSVGVAVRPEHGVRPDDLVKAADEALYAAKRAGRDRASLHQA